MPSQEKISDLRPGMQIRDAVYLLVEKQVRTAKNGSLFLSARLRDASGEIDARFWDLPQGVAEPLEVGQGVLVTGEVSSFRDRPQLRLDVILPHAVEARDFVPAPSRPLEEMRASLEGYVRSVADPWLRRLLEKVFLDAEFLPRFLEAPAAKEYHHACLGGLVEHTLGVTHLAEVVTQAYPLLPRDLILTVALLHDVGKVEAYEWEGGFRRSDEGRLLEHIYLGSRRVERAIEALEGFPAELRWRVMHALLAHHGEQTAGSPVRPQTLEAVVLHLLDMLDARVRGFQDHVERRAAPGASWTEWSGMFGTALYRGEEGQEAAEPAPPDSRPSAKPRGLWDDFEEVGEGELPL